jgi:hypothetical protein
MDSAKQITPKCPYERGEWNKLCHSNSSIVIAASISDVSSSMKVWWITLYDIRPNYLKKGQITSVSQLGIHGKKEMEVFQGK